jgi:hypothetical protein
MARTTYNQASSFWLDEFSSDSKTNVIELAAYKRAISNFVKILTARDDIKVRYSSGRDSYTDGKDIVISSDISNKQFDAIVGLALHEASHCKLTDFDRLKGILARLYHRGSDESKAFLPDQDICSRVNVSEVESILHLKDMINVIEDRRIDYYVMSTAKGYVDYYQSMYDKYFNSSIIDQALLTNQWTKVCMENYFHHIINFTNKNRNLQALPGLSDIWNLINLSDIKRLNNIEDSALLARSVLELIYTNVANHNNQSDELKCETPDEMPESNQPDESQDDQSTSNQPSSDNDDPNLDLPNQSKLKNDDDDNDSNDNDQPKPDKELTPRQQKSLNNAIQKQADFLNGDVSKKKVSESNKSIIESLADTSTSIETITDTYGKTINSIVIRGWSHGNLNIAQWNYNHVHNISESVASGLRLGSILARKLQTRDEERSIKTTRCNSGKIDRRLLAEIGFGSEKIFENTTIFTSKNSYIHISIDASGSMSGTKWNESIKTAIAIGKAASILKTVECEISIRTTARVYAHVPLTWIVYNSKTDNINQLAVKLSGLYASGSTPEGLCFAALQKSIQAESKNKQSYFINFSDGVPAFTSPGFHYGGVSACEQTRSQIQKMTASGIEILSYFIDSNVYNSNSFQCMNFKRMYGQNAKFINVNEISRLASTINELLQRSE